MNKRELVDAAAERVDVDAGTVEAVWQACMDVIVAAVAGGDRVVATNFGTFEPVTRAARTGRAPRTGVPVPIPEATVVRFRPAPVFAGFVADPASLPDPPVSLARRRAAVR